MFFSLALQNHKGFTGASLNFKTLYAIFQYLAVVKEYLHSLLIALNDVFKHIL